VLFVTETFQAETEITGYVAAKLFVSSSTTDADLFVGLHLFDPSGEEIAFQGSNNSKTAIGHGWLRASHRKTDPALSQFYRPHHTHDELWPLTSNKPVELDVEIWPTCIVVPAGYRVGMSVRGKDWSPGDPLHVIGDSRYALNCIVDPFLHKHAADRPAHIFGGINTLHVSDAQQSYLLLPIIPPK
jgi:predicted acyl esterase